MASEDFEIAKRARLREKAERRVGKSSRAAKSIPAGEDLELIHELEVHHVELELQNEELRRSQSELEEARKKYFDLYELAPIGYVTLDRNGHIKEINLTGAEMVGVERRQLNGRPFARYLAASDRNEFQRYCRRVLGNGARAECEVRLAPPDRPAIDAMVSGIAIPDGEGKLSRCHLAITDITVKKRAEERERLAVIGETAAKLVHEISNPLNGMLFNVEFLETSVAQTGDEILKATVGGLAKEVSRLNGLVRDFRNLHRREQYQFDPTSLGALAKEVVGGETVKYDSKGIHVELEFEPGLPLVPVDRGKFKQALFNLCKNAEEAMPEGGTLTLRGYRSGSKVILEVRDTGCGIPKSLDLSEPFTTTKPTGTGLGLMIVRQIMSLHHGSLSYSSEPGKGASFFLELPAHAPS